jgi:hypothetical protein
VVQREDRWASNCFFVATCSIGLVSLCACVDSDDFASTGQQQAEKAETIAVRGCNPGYLESDEKERTPTADCARLERNLGNEAELQRCYRAADGDQYTWLDYCNTVPLSLYGSCKNIASDNSQVKRGWCYNYWGSIITFDGAG